MEGYVQFQGFGEFPGLRIARITSRQGAHAFGVHIGWQELDLSHGGLVITFSAANNGWTMDRGGVFRHAGGTRLRIQEAVCGECG